MAKVVSQWSKDPSTQVGAVIVDRNKRIVSTGYNGFPAGVKDTLDRLADREMKLKMIIHAEENAILFARRDLTGMTMFIYPLPPCSNCGAKIIQAGITTVIAPEVRTDSKWFESTQISKQLFHESGRRLVTI